MATIDTIKVSIVAAQAVNGFTGDVVGRYGAVLPSWLRYAAREGWVERGEGDTLRLTALWYSRLMADDDAKTARIAARAEARAAARAEANVARAAADKLARAAVCCKRCKGKLTLRCARCD